MSQAYRPDIDGLRAVAVIPVVLFHAQVAGFGGGFVGVDVFFVISGFLITQVIFKEISAGGFSYIDFWERRARRLLPAIFFMALGCCIGAWFLYLPDQMRNLGMSVVFLSMFASNFWFWWKSGYFEAPADSTPLLHTWSLGVEEQFYLFFPIVLMACYRWWRSQLLLALSALALASLALSVYQVSQYPDAAYFLLPARAWELLLGALLALGIAGSKRHSRLTNEFLMVAGLLLVVVPMSLYSHATDFPGLAAVPPCVGTALLIYAGAQGQSSFRRLLELDAMVFFGRLSYSLYLWHWPLLALWSVLQQQPIGAMSVTDIALVIGASVFMAWVSLRFVEEPIRRRRLLGSRSQMFGASALCLAAFAAFGLASYGFQGFPQRVPEPVRQIADASRADSPEQKRCARVDLAALERGEFCELGARRSGSGQGGFLLWGDSHARALVPVVHEMGVAAGLNGWHTAVPGCPPVLGIEVRGQSASRNCAAQNALVIDFVRRHSVRLVLLASRWTVNGVWAGERRLWPTDSKLADLSVPELFDRQFRATVTALVAAGADVVVIEEVPYPRDYHPWRSAYAVWQGAGEGEIGVLRENFNTRAADFETFLDSLGDLPIVRIRSADYFCDAGFCPAVREGRSMYKDGHHLTPIGSMRLAEPLRELLQATAHERR